MRFIYIFIFSVLLFSKLNATQRAVVKAVRTSEEINIDAIFNEKIWNEITPITSFIQRLPLDGASPSEKSEMRIIYDSDYLYVKAIY